MVEGKAKMTTAKQLCIQQGYVPADCVFPTELGMLLFTLSRNGKSPCVGCNADCAHTKKLPQGDE